MKLICKFFNLLLTISIVCILLILGAVAGYLDKPIKAALGSYLRYNGFHATIDNLHFARNKLSIDNISFNLIDEAVGSLNKVEMVFNLNGTIRKPLIIIKTKVNNFSLLAKDKQKIVDTIISAEHQLDLFAATSEAKIHLDHIESKTLSNINGANLPTGSALCSYKNKYIINKYQTVDCKLNFGRQSFLALDAKIEANEIKAQGSGSNIPIMIYQIARKIFPSNEVILFLHEYINGGHINTAKFDLHLDKNFFQHPVLKAENLTGTFNISDIEFKYDKDFPPIKNIEMEVMLSGPQAKFLLNKAHMNNTIISNGLITLDWKDIDTSNVIISAISSGPASDLTDFIVSETHNDIKKKGIDLRKLTGTATSKIEIVIPLSPKIKNSYNITTEVKNAGLKIFKNNIELSKGTLEGLFNGKEIIFTGKAKINNFDSDLTYRHDLTDPVANEHSLKIKTKLQGLNQKLGVVKLLSGNGVFNFEYKGKNGQATIEGSSNLKNIEFYLDKISIYKKIGDSANLSLRGNFTSTSQDNIELKLLGDNNLKIIANITASDNRYKVVLPIISHYDTNLKGEVTSSADNFSVKLRGSSLDLSQAKMEQFLEKERDNGNTHLEINLDKVRLKNNISLTDLQLTLDCNKNRCFSGYLDSKIGTRSVKMLLKQAEDKEEWIINCDNAGALLKGVGIYSSMKRGTMLVIVDTKRQLAKSGEVVPIVDGKFTFRKFATTDQSFLAGLVSYLSVPGLQNILTNNKDIEFLRMKGKFSYIGNIVRITDTSAEGPYFDFTMYGTIDTLNRKVRVKGGVVPSIYGISTILKKIPILGKILSGGHRKGIFSAPFSIEKDY